MYLLLLSTYKDKAGIRHQHTNVCRLPLRAENSNFPETVHFKDKDVDRKTNADSE